MFTSLESYSITNRRKETPIANFCSSNTWKASRQLIAWRSINLMYILYYFFLNLFLMN